MYKYLARLIITTFQMNFFEGGSTNRQTERALE